MKERQLKRLKRNCWLDICLDYMISCKDAFKDYLNRGDLKEYSEISFTAIETYFNLNFNRMKNNPENFKNLEKMTFNFLHLVFSDCSNEIYQTFFSGVQKLKARVTYEEYLSFTRNMLLSFEQPQLLLPVFMFFDGVYSNENEMIVGFNSKISPIRYKMYQPYLDFSLNKLESYLLTADNMQQKENMFKRYILYFRITKKESLLTLSALSDKKRTENIYFIKEFNRYSILNKFLLLEKDLNINMNCYRMYSNVISEIHFKNRDLIVDAWRLVESMQKDIFRHRKHLFVDVELSISFSLRDNTVDGISISENIKNGTIIVKYTYLGHEKVLPIVIENVQACIGGYNYCDYLVLFLLLQVYDIFDYKVFPTFIFHEELRSFFEYLSEINIKKEVDALYSGKARKGRKLLKRVFVDAYIRKLPNGYKASDIALNYAKNYNVILEEGYTIVRPFEKGLNNTNFKEEDLRNRI